MSQSDRKRISGIGSGHIEQPEHCTNHEANLRFLGGALPYDRLLYPFRRVLENLQAMLSRCQESGAARGAERDSCPSVLDVDEHFGRANFNPM
jgi:hypothetical protein